MSNGRHEDANGNIKINSTLSEGCSKNVYYNPGVRECPRNRQIVKLAMTNKQL